MSRAEEGTFGVVVDGDGFVQGKEVNLSSKSHDGAVEVEEPTQMLWPC